MPNIIKLKGKLTTGAPAIGDLAVREMCFVIPDNTLYIKKDATNIVMLGGLGLLNSPTFTGTPTAPTPNGTSNNTEIATTAFVKAITSALANGDMLKSVYDTNNNGRPDTADNALLLGGVAAASYATQTYVTTQISALINSAPGVLDTLSELATALGNDPNFATTITNSLALKLDANSIIDGGTF
jgi:hypothetical protein